MRATGNVRTRRSPAPAGYLPTLLSSLLLGKMPLWLAVQLLAVVCVTLSIVAVLLLGRIADAAVGTDLRAIPLVTIALPIVVMIPLLWTVIRQLRDIAAQRDRAVAASGTDELTGLPNRRWLHDLLERTLAGARRSGQSLTIALLDVDDFKSVNDAHGHQTGDALLAAIAAACDRTLRASDAVGRWGGEEFVVVLPDTGSNGARVILERLRAAVAEVAVTDAAGCAVCRSVSIGAVTVDPAVAMVRPFAPLGLIAVADRAMYRAKRAGKDGIRIEVMRLAIDRPADLALSDL